MTLISSFNVSEPGVEGTLLSYGYIQPRLCPLVDDVFLLFSLSSYQFLESHLGTGIGGAKAAGTDDISELVLPNILILSSRYWLILAMSSRDGGLDYVDIPLRINYQNNY